jgi:hypothetical protein
LVYFADCGDADVTLLTMLAFELLAAGAATIPVASPAAPPVAGTEKPVCKSSRPEYGDTMHVQCALRTSEAPTKFKFEVRFLGGHDDTRASLSASLNGKPLSCEEGSKPQLEGEFGEVSIHCQFSSKDAQELEVDVQWYHAQYSDFVLEAR